MPAIGIALGGGFARGIAHIACSRFWRKKAFRCAWLPGPAWRHHGAAYCSGLTIAELEELSTTFASRLSRAGPCRATASPRTTA